MRRIIVSDMCQKKSTRKKCTLSFCVVLNIWCQVMLLCDCIRGVSSMNYVLLKTYSSLVRNGELLTIKKCTIRMLPFLQCICFVGRCRDQIGMKCQDHIRFHFFKHPVDTECNAVHPHTVLLSHYVTGKSICRIRSQIAERTVWKMNFLVRVRISFVPPCMFNWTNRLAL